MSLLRITSDDSSRFFTIRIHNDEPEASIAKERASEEYIEIGRWRIIQDEE